MGGAPLLSDLGLGLLQCSTWSPGCWNTPFPRLQLTCWWPGECPQWVGGPLLQRWHHSFPFIHSVPRCISRASVTPSPPPAPDSAPVESQPAAEDAVGPLEPSPRAAQPVRRDLGKVPKWLKLPGTVGGVAGQGGAAGQEPRTPRSPGMFELQPPRGEIRQLRGPTAGNRIPPHPEQE